MWMADCHYGQMVEDACGLLDLAEGLDGAEKLMAGSPTEIFGEIVKGKIEEAVTGAVTGGKQYDALKDQLRSSVTELKGTGPFVVRTEFTYQVYQGKSGLFSIGGREFFKRPSWTPVRTEYADVTIKGTFNKLADAKNAGRQQLIDQTQRVEAYWKQFFSMLGKR
jgi:hypothetical protein